jgi:hypothetical protein
MKYLICLFAIPGGLIVGVSQTPDQAGLGLFMLILGSIGALTLQSSRFTEWLGQFF